MNAGLRCLLLGGFTVWSGCRPTSASRTQAELSIREQRLATRLANVSESRTSAVARWILPREMREVSGLALTSDGRLLAHGDERGRVYVIDPRGGALLKSFGIGNRDADASADFEGITVAQGRIFMVASNGMLYEFAEGEDGNILRWQGASLSRAQASEEFRSAKRLGHIVVSAGVERADLVALGIAHGQDHNRRRTPFAQAA